MHYFRKMKAARQQWEEFPSGQLEISLLRGDLVLIHHSADMHDLYCVPFSRLLVRGPLTKKRIPAVLSDYLSPCPVCSLLEKEQKTENQLKLF